MIDSLPYSSIVLQIRDSVALVLPAVRRRKMLTWDRQSRH